MPTNPGGQLVAKLLLIGNSDTRKSALLMRFTNAEWAAASTRTIGIDFQLRTIEIDGRTVRVQTWDTAGQERFRSITTAYYRGAHGLMFVFSVYGTSIRPDCRRSFDDLANWISSAAQHGKAHTPRLLVGDVQSAADEGDHLPRVVSREEAMAFATASDMKYIEVDAGKGEGVEEAFFTLTRDAVRRYVEGLAPTRHLYGGGPGMLPISPASLVHLCVAHLVTAHHADPRALEALSRQLPTELRERLSLAVTDPLLSIEK